MWQACPSCSELIDLSRSADERVVCPACGKKFHLIPKAGRTEPAEREEPVEVLGVEASVPVPVASSSKSLNCPFCGSDTVARAEAIYEAGTYSKQSGHVAVAFTDDGMVPVFGGSKGKQQSLLARRLAPPVRPNRRTTACELVIGVLFAGAAIAALVCFATGEHRLSVLFAGAAAFLVFPLVLSYSAGTRHHRKQLAVWQEMYNAWQQLWYCQKCGQTYQTSLAAPVRRTSQKGLMKARIL